MVENREEAIEKILVALREGQPEYNAARAGGIEYSRWWDWKQDTPGLQQRVNAARKSRIVLYEDALHKAAIKGSVTACLVLLRKESREWRELLDGTIEPNPGMMAMGQAAAAGAAAIINMLSEEKRLRIKAAMARENLLVLPPPSMNGNGSNGNGASHNGNGSNGNGPGH